MEYPRYVFGPLGKMKLVTNEESHKVTLESGYSDSSLVLVESAPLPVKAKPSIDISHQGAAPITNIPYADNVVVLHPKQEPDELSSKTKAQLVELVRALKLTIPHNATKAQLLEILGSK